MGYINPEDYYGGIVPGEYQVYDIPELVRKHRWWLEFKEKHPDARRFIVFSDSAVYPKEHPYLYSEDLHEVQYTLLDIDDGYQIYNSIRSYPGKWAKRTDYVKHLLNSTFIELMQMVYMKVFKPKEPHDDAN